MPAAPSPAVEDIVEALRARGARVTTPRRLLVECLVRAGGHRTAEELAAEVRSAAPDVHLSTIYRNLEELEHLGVVSHAHLGHGPAMYHLATATHAHLVCRGCGAELEAGPELFADLAREAMARFGFQVEPYHFAVVGSCERCRRALGSDPVP